MQIPESRHQTLTNTPGGFKSPNRSRVLPLTERAWTCLNHLSPYPSTFRSHALPPLYCWNIVSTSFQLVIGPKDLTETDRKTLDSSVNWTVATKQIIVLWIKKERKYIWPSVGGYAVGQDNWWSAYLVIADWNQYQADCNARKYELLVVCQKTCTD